MRFYSPGSLGTRGLTFVWGKWVTNPFENPHFPQRPASEAPKTGGDPCSNHRAYGDRDPRPRSLGHHQLFLYIGRFSASLELDHSMARRHLGPPLAGGHSKAALRRVRSVWPGTPAAGRRPRDSLSPAGDADARVAPAAALGSSLRRPLLLPSRDLSSAPASETPGR